MLPHDPTPMPLSAGPTWSYAALVGLGAAALVVVVERAVAMRHVTADAGLLRATLIQALRSGGFASAREAIGHVRHPAARVALRGMLAPESETTREEAAACMRAQAMIEHRALVVRLVFLSLLGKVALLVGAFAALRGIGLASSLGAGAPGLASAWEALSRALDAAAAGVLVGGVTLLCASGLSSWARAARGDAEVLSLEVLAHLDAAWRRAVARPSPRAGLRVVSPSPRARET